MKRNAFTMLELVMVIVIIGILAALAIPRLDRDVKQEAADNLLSAIRYTQHLSLLDDKHKFGQSNWQKSFWTIEFTSSTTNPLNNFYTICSDDDRDGVIQKNECAMDPSNNKYYYNAGGVTTAIDADESPSIFIGKKYGIISITGSGGCNGVKHLGFDHLGRPHVSFSSSSTPDYSSYMKTQCQFTFGMKNGDSFVIEIESETGYARIKNQNAS
jgi:prepilin-type N-terminal cleavage/methylation domain-containing protein